MTAAIVTVHGATEGATAPPARGWLQRLSIRDFRNIHRADLELPADGIALVGENGHGKSNLLESIYYLRLLRSVRGARDVELATFGADGFHLGAELCDAPHRSIAIGFERAGRRKKVMVDGAVPERLSDALGLFPAVLFSPQDAWLVTGGPGARRRFLDVTLALTSRPYLAALQRYRAALVRRNASLRERGVTRAAAMARSAVWEPALAASGAVLWQARREWVASSNARYEWLCAAIGELGAARMRYVSSLAAPDDAVESALAAALEAHRPADAARGLTLSGPHRDDLALTVSDRELRTYGSAGQQRTAAIALRLLEADTLRDRSGAEPLVLLDDPFAELDTRRSARILELLNTTGRGQTVLAVPREGDIPDGLTRLDRWRIIDGEIATAPR